MKVKHLLMGATASALVATSGVSVVAQDEPPEPQALFTGVLNHDATENPSWSQGVFEPVIECHASGRPMEVVIEDIYLGTVLEATDPRIAGTFDWVWSQTVCPSEEGWPYAFAVDANYRITNDGGSWTGGGPGFVSLEVYEQGEPNDAFMATLTGSGEYEGLTAILIRRRESRPDQEPPWEDVVQGVIVNGPLPPRSDFDDSAAARAFFEQNAIESEMGPSGGPPPQGIGIVLDEAMSIVADELGDDLDGSVESTAETIADFLEWTDDPDWAERQRTALEAIGVAAEDTSFYVGFLGQAGGGDKLTLHAVHYPDADPDALATWFHPDNQQGPSYVTERQPGTTAEAVRIGGRELYAYYLDGAPTYVLIEGGLVLELSGPDGPGSYPDDAAVDLFFEVLPDLTEVDVEMLEAEA